MYCFYSWMTFGYGWIIPAVAGGRSRKIRKMGHPFCKYVVACEQRDWLVITISFDMLDVAIEGFRDVYIGSPGNQQNLPTLPLT